MKAKWKTQYQLLLDGFPGEQAQIWYGQNCLYCLNQVSSCMVLWNFRNLKWRVYMVNFCCSICPLNSLQECCLQCALQGSSNLVLNEVWNWDLSFLPENCPIISQFSLTGQGLKLRMFQYCPIFPVTTVWLFPEKYIGVCVHVTGCSFWALTRLQYEPGTWKCGLRKKWWQLLLVVTVCQA